MRYRPKVVFIAIALLLAKSQCFATGTQELPEQKTPASSAIYYTPDYSTRIEKPPKIDLLKYLNEFIVKLDVMIENYEASYKGIVDKGIVESYLPLKQIRMRWLLYKFEQEYNTLKSQEKIIRQLQDRYYPDYVSNTQQTIQKNFENVKLDPTKVYEYLGLNPPVTFKEAKNTLNEQISTAQKNYDTKELEVLRQINYVLSNPYAKEEYDAYLHNSLEKLIVPTSVATRKDLENIIIGILPQKLFALADLHRKILDYLK